MSQVRVQHTRRYLVELRQVFTADVPEELCESGDEGVLDDYICDHGDLDSEDYVVLDDDMLTTTTRRLGPVE